jgi:3-oxoacyl-ACP reductase-like protein
MASPAPTASTSTTAPPASAPSAAPSANSANPAATAEIIPSATTLLQAARLSIQQDKPIQLDYYVETANLKAFIGEDPETKEKVLLKNREEFTSLVSKMYKVGDDFLIMTENSIYIVSGKIQKRKVNLASLQGDE